MSKPDVILIARFDYRKSLIAPLHWAPRQAHREFLGLVLCHS